MPPTERITRLEAPCLRASRETVRLITIRPCDVLSVSDDRGPHYSQDRRQAATERAMAILEMSIHQNADLVVAPEYFLPIEALKHIIDNPNSIRQNAVFVFPLETVIPDQLDEVIETSNQAEWQVETAEYESRSGKSYLNTCAILHRNSDCNQIFFQHKMVPSPIEQQGLIRGTEYFVFEGRNLALMVLICSDANDRTYHNTWADSAATKTGLFLVHAQWNPASDYPEYDSFQSAIFNKEQGEHRVILSCNWGGASSIDSVNYGNRSYRFRSRIFRRRDRLRPGNFRIQSKNGMHVEQRILGRNGNWEIWHVLPQPDHTLVIDLARPYEDAPFEETYRGYSVTNVTYFYRNGDGEPYVQGIPTDLLTPFWTLMRDLGVDNSFIEEIGEMSLYDLEILCNSCLTAEKDSWHENDVARRIPTAQVLCPAQNCSQCVEGTSSCANSRREWQEEVQDFAECLQEFSGAEIRTSYHLSLDSDQQYPCNLAGESGTVSGWLFHAKGSGGQRLAKKISTLLGKQTQNSSKKIVLCVVRAGRDIPSEEEIFSEYRDVSKDKSRPGDILDPDGRSRLEVVNLTP